MLLISLLCEGSDVSRNSRNQKVLSGDAVSMLAWRVEDLRELRTCETGAPTSRRRDVSHSVGQNRVKTAERSKFSFRWRQLLLRVHKNSHCDWILDKNNKSWKQNPATKLVNCWLFNDRVKPKHQDCFGETAIKIFCVCLTKYIQIFVTSKRLNILKCAWFEKWTDPIELTCQEQECVEFQDLIEAYANPALATASYLAETPNWLLSCF